jgi:hypothetical protein
LVYNQLLSLRQQLEREAADQSEDEADRTEEFMQAIDEYTRHDPSAVLRDIGKPTGERTHTPATDDNEED